jgi:hypothetical protein
VRLSQGFGECSFLFEERVSLKLRKPVKAFADETMFATQILVALCEYVLQPRGILSKHVECLLLGAELLEYFRLGDEVEMFNERMFCIARQHHVLFMTLYDLDCITPKFHYLYHAIKKRNMNTLNPERLHKVAKASAVHAYGDRVESSTMTRCLLRYLAEIEDPKAFQEIRAP